jgi:NADP-dependent 3-hydroxy acid dehydrogenase YdfG
MKKKSFFERKVAVVTGASGGIGKELARQLVDCGAQVVMTGRSYTKLRSAAEEMNLPADRCMLYEMDVRNAAHNDNMVRDVMQRFGKIDILIANAGSSGNGTLAQSSPAVMKEIIDTNIYGSLFPFLSCADELKKSNGTFMLISSLAALHGLPEHGAYSLSKMSLRAMAQTLRTELRNTGMKVCISFVGFTKNEESKMMFDQNGHRIVVPERPAFLVSSRKKTANAILQQIKGGKFESCTSFDGLVYKWMTAHFSAPFSMMIKTFYREKKYAPAGD